MYIATYSCVLHTVHFICVSSSVQENLKLITACHEIASGKHCQHPQECTKMCLQGDLH